VISAPAAAVRAYGPPVATPALVYGAVGGALGGALVLVILAILAGPSGHRPVAAPNAFGAWFVRWLQTAAPSALDSFYADATLGGIALALAVGALLGAVFAGAIARLPDDHPLAWGLVWGLMIWAAARWLVLPALDPVLLQAFDARPILLERLPDAVVQALNPRVAGWLDIPALLPALAGFGLWLGLWVHAGRTALAEPPAPEASLRPRRQDRDDAPLPPTRTGP
jgi:hypothetical protein